MYMFFKDGMMMAKLNLQQGSIEMYMSENTCNRIIEVRIQKGIHLLLGKKISREDVFHDVLWIEENDTERGILQEDLFDWCISPIIVPCVCYVDEDDGHVYTVAHIYYKGPNPYEIWMKDDVLITTPLDVMLGGEE